MHMLANSTGINLSDRARITRPLVRLATVAHALVRATSALVPTLGGCDAKMCRDEQRTIPGGIVSGVRNLDFCRFSSFCDSAITVDSKTCITVPGKSRHDTHEYVRDTCCEVILAQALSPNTFLRPPGLPSLHLCSIPRSVRASRAQRYARPSRSALRARSHRPSSFRGL